MIAHTPRSGSLPGDQFDQYCEVRLAAKVNDDTHKSMLSCLESWLRGRPGARLSFPDGYTERNHMPHALYTVNYTERNHMQQYSLQCTRLEPVVVVPIKYRVLQFTVY